ARARESPRGAAPRRAVDHRGGGDAAGEPRKAPRHRRDAACELRANAGEIPGDAERDAGTGAKAETEARLPSPQTRLIAVDAVVRLHGDNIGRLAPVRYAALQIFQVLPHLFERKAQRIKALDDVA